jgi:predicted Zn-dependent protease with MMP-like domain
LIRGDDPPSLEEFQDLVEEALEEFPEAFQKLIENVAIVVEDVASPADAARAGVRNPMYLLGMYTGVPFTQWGKGSFMGPPDVIRIYRLPILTLVKSAEDIREKVRNVVLHELGHRAGLDEGRLRDLGVY